MSKGSPLKGANPLKGRGPWSEAEDEILRNHVSEHGAGSWKSVVEKTGLKRDAQSCRLRWGSYLDPNVNRSPFTEAEDRLLLQMVSWEGSTNWVGIATSAFPTRTGYQLQGRWHMLMNKIRKAQGGGRSPAWLEPGAGSTEKGGWMLKRDWPEDIHFPPTPTELDSDMPRGGAPEKDLLLIPQSAAEERDGEGRGGTGGEDRSGKRQREWGEDTAAKRQVAETEAHWAQNQMASASRGPPMEEFGLMTGDRWRNVAAREGWGLRGLLMSPNLGESVENPSAGSKRGVELDLNLSLKQTNSSSNLSSENPWGGAFQGVEFRAGEEAAEAGGGGGGREGGCMPADLELRLFTDRRDAKGRESVPGAGAGTGMGLSMGMGLDLESLIRGKRSPATLSPPGPGQQRNSLAWLASRAKTAGGGSGELLTGQGGSGGVGGGEHRERESGRWEMGFILALTPGGSQWGAPPPSGERGWNGFDPRGASPLPPPPSIAQWRRVGEGGGEMLQSVVLHADTGVPLEDLAPTTTTTTTTTTTSSQRTRKVSPPRLDFGQRQVAHSPWATAPGMSLELSRAMSAVGLSSAKSSNASPWSASPQSALTSARSMMSSLASPAPPNRTVDFLSAASSPPLGAAGTTPNRGAGKWPMLGLDSGSAPEWSPTDQTRLGGGQPGGSPMAHMPSLLRQQAGARMMGAEAWIQRTRLGLMSPREQTYNEEGR